MEEPTAQFESFLSTSEFLFVVYYRGHWCPFCNNYAKTLQTLAFKISAAGGKTIMVTSEVAKHQDAFRKSSGYTETIIVDTKNLIAKELKTRGVIDIAVTQKSGYVNGMAQPGVLVIKKDGTVLYSWAIDPSLMNLYGAKDRPDLNQVWDNVEAKMHDKPIVHKDYKLQTLGMGLKQKIFG